MPTVTEATSLQSSYLSLNTASHSWSKCLGQRGTDHQVDARLNHLCLCSPELALLFPVVSQPQQLPVTFTLLVNADRLHCSLQDFWIDGIVSPCYRFTDIIISWLGKHSGTHEYTHWGSTMGTSLCVTSMSRRNCPLKRGPWICMKMICFTITIVVCFHCYC